MKNFEVGCTSYSLSYMIGAIKEYKEPSIKRDQYIKDVTAAIKVQEAKILDLNTQYNNLIDLRTNLIISAIDKKTKFFEKILIGEDNND